jgi:hypothetical protein
VSISTRGTVARIAAALAVTGAGLLATPSAAHADSCVAHNYTQPGGTAIVYHCYDVANAPYRVFGTVTDTLDDGKCAYLTVVWSNNNGGIFVDRSGGVCAAGSSQSFDIRRRGYTRVASELSVR